FVGLVPDVYRYAYPSKTATYLEQGCPLIVAVESKSSLARDVVEYRLGRAVPPGQPRAIANAILDMSEDRESRAEARRNARAFVAGHLSEAAILARWGEVFHMDRIST